MSKRQRADSSNAEPPNSSNAETVQMQKAAESCRKRRKKPTQFQRGFMKLMPEAAKEGLVTLTVQDSASLGTALQNNPERVQLLIPVDDHQDLSYAGVEMLATGKQRDELIMKLHGKGGGDVELWFLLTKHGWIPDGFKGEKKPTAKEWRSASRWVFNVEDGIDHSKLEEQQARALLGGKARNLEAVEMQMPQYHSRMQNYVASLDQKIDARSLLSSEGLTTALSVMPDMENYLRRKDKEDQASKLLFQSGINAVCKEMPEMLKYAKGILERQGTSWCPAPACPEYVGNAVTYLDKIVEQASQDANFKQTIADEYAQSLVSQLLLSSGDEQAEFAGILLGLAQVRPT